jgi:hypothetical protein
MVVSEADLNEVAWDVNAYSFFHVDMKLDEIDFNLDSPSDFQKSFSFPEPSSMLLFCVSEFF